MTTHRLRFAALGAVLLLGALGAAAQERDQQQDASMPIHDHRMHDVTVLHLVQTAQTAADHETVVKRFEAEAADFDKQAQLHSSLAKHYRKGLGAGPRGDADALARHCDNLAKNLKTSANDAREMAQLHRSIAKALAK